MSHRRRAGWSVTPGRGCLRSVIFSTVPLDYTRQRHHQVAEALGSQGEVTWVEPLGVRRPVLRDLRRVTWLRLRSVEPHQPAIRRVRLHAVPPGLPLGESVNRVAVLPRLLRSLPDAPDLFWVYYPSRLVAAVLARFPRVPVVYDCVSNFHALAGLPRRFAALEARLLERSAAVLADSSALLAQCRRMRPDAIQLEPSVDTDRFAFRLQPPPHAGVSRCVFCGSLKAIHFDAGLMREAALAFPRCQFDLYGPVEPPVRRALNGITNVTLHGMVPHERVPQLLWEAHAVILPYLVTEFTRAVFPAKTFESLAVGVPTVATALPDLVRLAPALAIGETREVFLAALGRALDEDDPAARRHRRAAAEEHDEARFKERVTDIALSLAPVVAGSAAALPR